MLKIRQLLALCALLACARPSFAQQQVDVLIRGGSLVDGTGSAPRRADVGVRGDRITFVGDAAASRVTATKTIDAAGLVVAPGFIDPHTHTQGDLSSPVPEHRRVTGRRELGPVDAEDLQRRRDHRPHRPPATRRGS